MEAILPEIALNTRPSNAWSFTMTSPPGGNTDSFEVFFSEPIVPERGKKLELALLSLRTSYSWPNIRAGAGTANNEFRYSHDDGATWTTIALSEGAYEIEGINAAIQSAMRVNGHWDEMNSQYYVTLAPQSCNTQGDRHDRSLRLQGRHSKQQSQDGSEVAGRLSYTHRGDLHCAQHCSNLRC